MSYRLLRPLLFKLPPESAHRFAFAALAPLQRLLEHRRLPRPAPPPSLAVRLWGLEFPNPIGLAAGFDKNGELPHVWSALGFGFAELGTVTAEPQAGNPPPRLFRLPADRALINRLGFNNQGASRVAEALALRLGHRHAEIPLGINIGKSRITPLEDAIADYRRSFRTLLPLADYLVVNVSSPNTPGLRDLQSAAQLSPLLDALHAENRRLANLRRSPPKPLLVKVAPDLGPDELEAIASVAENTGVAGLIATNTTIARPPLRSPARLVAEAGGLSGAPLAERALAAVRTLYRATNGRLPIVGVGGIFDVDDVYARIRAGASLVQVYTGFVYQGPGLPRRLVNGLAARLARDGLASVSDAVGLDA